MKPDYVARERKAFEAWCKESGHFTDWSRSPDHSTLNGEYLKPRVELAWRAWLASAARAFLPTPTDKEE